VNACGCPVTSVGVQHEPGCWQSPVKQSREYPMFVHADPSLARIALALERIAVLLEHLPIVVAREDKP
jgi:hypothetical protein